MTEIPSSSSMLLHHPGSLQTQLLQQTQHALSCGALHSIDTECEFLEEGGVRFLVRILANLARKEKAKQDQQRTQAQTGQTFNPFLPYDQDLFVTDISETHLCLLNKFNVVDHHLLIVTRAFEEQESILNRQDFEAMWACLAEVDGLAFYNGGKPAGASQPHKHLQLVPFPLVPGDPQIPLAATFSGSEVGESGVEIIPTLPFAHALVRWDLQQVEDPLNAADLTLQVYYQLMEALNLLKAVSEDPEAGQIPDVTGAYNLLATREWMMVIPRRHESYASISVNSLGFAGTLLVRDQEQLQHLKKLGPMQILEQVGLPR